MMTSTLSTVGTLAGFVLLGLITRGWFLRFAGFMWVVLGAICFVAISVQPSNAIGYSAAGVFYGGIGVAMWVGGHYVHYRRKGWWKSRTLGRAYARRVTRENERRAAREHAQRRAMSQAI